jgi:hypothetical protein
VIGGLVLPDATKGQIDTAAQRLVALDGDITKRVASAIEVESAKLLTELELQKPTLTGGRARLAGEVKAVVEQAKADLQRGNLLAAGAVLERARRDYLAVLNRRTARDA